MLFKDEDGKFQRSSHPDDLNSAIPFVNAHRKELVGVGEVGLDFTPRYIKDQCNKEEQREVLRAQVVILCVKLVVCLWKCVLFIKNIESCLSGVCNLWPTIKL